MPEHLTDPATPKVSLLISMVLGLLLSSQVSPPAAVWFEVLEPQRQTLPGIPAQSGRQTVGAGGALGLPWSQMTDTEAISQSVVTALSREHGSLFILITIK